MPFCDIRREKAERSKKSGLSCGRRPIGRAGRRFVAIVTTMFSEEAAADRTIEGQSAFGAILGRCVSNHPCSLLP
jgi:hypothetical protein